MPLHMSCDHTYCLQKTVVTPYLTMPAHTHTHTHILHVLWPAEVSPCYLLCAWYQLVATLVMVCMSVCMMCDEHDTDGVHKRQSCADRK